jgi:predicted Zn-dependent protease
MTQLVEKFSKFPQVWAYQANLLFLHDKPEQADAALQKAFDLDANFAFGHWLRGLMRLNEGEIVGALILFRKTVELLDPNAKDLLAQAYTRIGELELNFNRPIAARVALERARRLAPQTADLQQAFENVFGSDSRLPDVARREYHFRSASDDRWKTAFEGAATGRLTDALKAADAIAQAEPNNAAAQFNLALVRAWLGDNARAVEALDKSIDNETDEEKATEAGALAEVLRLGSGMEANADYVEHRAAFQILNGEAVGNVINGWGQSGRLIVIDANREEGMFTGVILEGVPDLGTGIGTPVARLEANIFLHGDMVRLWHSNRTLLDEVVGELRSAAGNGISEPRYDIDCAKFGDIVADIMVFPTRENAEPEQVAQKMRERGREYFEDTWLRRSLKSLSGSSPLDSANHPSLRRRLPGLIRFLDECLTGATPREEGKTPTPTYDFDRLRRKLGLKTAPRAEGAEIDFETLGAAELAGIKADKLSDAQTAQAFRAALRLDAPDLAGAFARQAVGRATIADRYPYFSHLTKQAREEGNHTEVLRWLSEADSADRATNEGKRCDDYALARGQALARSGDVEGAYTVFKDAIAQSPAALSLASAAAESMLGKKMGVRAQEFAEHGLKQARAQNNRDGEQQFLELVAAAKKQGA